MVSASIRSLTTIWPCSEDCRRSGAQATGDSRYLGACATGISVRRLVGSWSIPIPPSKKSRWKDVVREGIQMEAFSTPRPGALEDEHKDALERGSASTDAFQPYWFTLWMADVDKGRQRLKIRSSCGSRVSLTNAVRHGHASWMILILFEDKENYLIELQDNGLG